MRYFWTFILLFSVGIVHAQSNYSESFIYFPKNSHLYLPSNACIDNDLQSTLIYRTYLGQLSIIRTYYADLNLDLNHFNHKKSNKKQVVGISFYNDREGEFFHKTRIMLRYALHLPLNKRLHLSVGSAFQLLNYGFTASGSGVAGSDFGISGDLSSTIYSRSFKFGVSINDFNNPQIRPINYTFNIYRYATIFAEKKFILNENTTLVSAGKWNIVQGNQSTLVLQTGLLFSNIVGLNGFYKLNHSWGFAFDIVGLKLFQDFMDLSFAYQIPAQQIYPTVNQYEINLSYYIRNSKK